MASAPPSTIPAIQYLRGIAALMVVALHLQVQLGRLGAPATDLAALSAGVDIFFVISGFIMWVTTATRPKRTAKDFMKDRLIRVVPLYWIVTGAMLAVILVRPQLAQTAVIDSTHVLLSFLFIPTPNPAELNNYTPLLIPGWTLNYELFFYAIFALAIYFGAANLKKRAACVFVSFLIFFIVGQWLSPSGVLGFYSKPIILNFVIGVAIGILYLSKALRSHVGWWLLIGIGCVILAFGGWDQTNVSGSLAVSLAAAAIVLGSILVPSRLPTRPLLYLGNWSYSLYLIHPLILSACYQAWQLSGTRLPHYVFVIGGLLLCIGTAAISFGVIERPLTAFLKARGSRRTQVHTIYSSISEARDTATG